MELLKGAHVKPFLGVRGPEFGLPMRLGRLAEKPVISGSLTLQRNIIRVEYRERAAAHGSHNPVQLPVAKNVPVPTAGVLQERKEPLITEYETIVGIEHGPAPLGGEIKWILRQIIFSGDWLRRGASDVERRDIIDGVGPGIGRKE